MWGKEMCKWLAEDTITLYGAIIRLHFRYYCCFMEGYSTYIGTASTLHIVSFDFVLCATAALWKDIRFTWERHLRYIVGGQT